MRDRPERILFFVVGASALLMVWLWLLFGKNDLDSAGAVALIALSMVCAFFAIEGRNAMRYLRSIGPGGVEFRTWEDIASIEEISLPPRPSFTPIPNEFNVAPVTSEEKWTYEFGSDLLFHLRHLGVDPAELTGPTQRRYRRLVKWVGQAALKGGEEHKALQILSSVAHLEDLDFDETFYLARARWYVALSAHNAAPEPRDSKCRDERREGLIEAAQLFERAKALDSEDGECWWALGWIYDELGQYDRAIRADARAIELDSTLRNWCLWNMAVSHVNLEDYAEAMNALRKIARGSWWTEIYDDVELAPLKASAFAVEFQSLYEANRTEERPA